MKEARFKRLQTHWVAHQAPLSLQTALVWVEAVPDPLSGERDGLVVLLPVEHGWRHAYHAALQPHRVAFGNATVLQFLQDHRRFLHLFGCMREEHSCLNSQRLEFMP